MPPRRSDLLEHWRSRGTISAADYAVAQRFVRLYERADLAVLRAIDFREERVGTGRRGGGVDHRFAARSELLALKPVLGEVDYGLLCRVIGRGEDVAAKNDDERRYLMRRIRDALGRLGELGAEHHSHEPA